MGKVRVVYRADGGISVIHPAPNSRREDETEAEWFERVFSKSMHDELEGCDYDDVNTSNLPQTRKYREAWTGSKGKGISIDAAKKVKGDSGELPKGGERSEADRDREKLIQAEMWKMAEERLVAKGEL